MNREEIINLAREAGFQCLLPSEHIAATGCIYDSGDDEITPLLERFAAIVASAAQAKEREACANSMAKIVMIPTYTHGALVKLSDVVNAIRAMGQA